MTIERPISLQTTDDIKTLCDAAVNFPFDVDVVSGHYIIDAKSFMGIFTLNRSRPMTLSVHADEATAATFLDRVSSLLHES